MKKNTRKTPSPPVEPAPEIVTDLGTLERIATKERFCTLDFGGTKRRVAVRSLKPAEAEQVREVLTGALPPKVVVGDGVDAKEKWDFENPDYLAAKRQNELKGRALALYLACPIYRTAIDQHLAETSKTVKDREEILKFVQDKLDEPTVIKLYNEILGDETSPREYADFFSKTA